MIRLRSFLIGSACVAVSALILASCSARKPKVVPTRQEAFLSELTSSDTTEVLSRAQDVVDKIIAGDLSGALSGLGQLQGDTLYNISSEKIAAISKRFQEMNFHQAKLDGYSFVDPEHNEIRFRVAFGQTEAEAAQLSTLFAINALKVDGKWYFTLMQ